MLHAAAWLFPGFTCRQLGGIATAQRARAPHLLAHLPSPLRHCQRLLCHWEQVPEAPLGRGALRQLEGRGGEGPRQRRRARCRLLLLIRARLLLPCRRLPLLLPCRRLLLLWWRQRPLLRRVLLLLLLLPSLLWHCRLLLPCHLVLRLLLPLHCLLLLLLLLYRRWRRLLLLRLCLLIVWW